MAYSLMEETERVNQSESGGGIHRKGIRGGLHFNSLSMFIKEDIKVKQSEPQAKLDIK